MNFSRIRRDMSCATRLLIGSLFVLGLTTLIDAQDAATAVKNWHQWRGPHATGVSPTANPPVEWSETKNVRWKVPIPGEGTATPIVWGDQVFIQTAINTGKKGEAPPAAATA